MVLHMPWTRNLGGPRVQLELAEEFRAMGHIVDKFDYYDAFPKVYSSQLAQFFRPGFSEKAKTFVQENAHRFDIIDAHQGNLPFSKEELGFEGLLVTRSAGLYVFYDEFKKQEKSKQPPQKIKTRLKNWLRSWKHRKEDYLFSRSFKTCDSILVPNNDELTYIRDVMKLGEKCRFIPHGISQERQMAFVQAVQPAKVRLAHKQIAFVGSWGTRKGSQDWAKIIQRVKTQVPEASFLFLGTGLDTQKVLGDLNISDCDWIQVVPKYNSKELPRLLSQATIGAFPSYIEGFGLAVLEKLACGLPTVAYDVPGPREMLQYLDQSLLTPSGDIQKFSQRLIDLLNLDSNNYAQLSQKCIQVIDHFSGSKIARDTLDSYYQYLEKKNDSNSSPQL